MNNITFIKNQGGLNLTSPSEDNISGLVFYSNTLPAGFSASNIQVVYSDLEAINLGVTTATFPIENYQISEFFRINPNATLYLSFNTTETISASYSFSGTASSYTEVQDLQVYTNGIIRQIGVLNYNSFTSSMTDIGALQTIASNLETINMPCSIIFGNNTKGLALSSLPNLRSLTSPKVSMVIGQDGSSKGLSLYTTYGISIPAVGAALGTISLAKVCQNIGWVGGFPIKNEGTLEYDEPAFGNGTLVKNVTDTQLTTIQNSGYIFLRKLIGSTQTFWNDSPTAVVATNDYSFIESNRVFDKARRLLRINVLPFINSNILINASNGQIDPLTLKVIENACNSALTNMVSNGEISGYKVVIDPTQNVLSTSKLNIVIAIVPLGVARQIVITLGFSLSI